MAIVIHTDQGPHEVVVESMDEAGLVKLHRLDRRLWLNADKDQVVEDGDEEAAFLYGNEGQLVPEREAEALGAMQPAPPSGSSESDSESEPTSEPKPDSGEKASKTTPGNKQAGKAADKSGGTSEESK